MPNILKTDGSEFNASYSLEAHEGRSGLVLESWGPSHRNSEYNAAFDELLLRLHELGIPSIEVIVISAELIRVRPNPAERSVYIDGAKKILLGVKTAKQLRLEIGRQQASIKKNPSTAGGNRTKRILIVTPLLSHASWKEVAEGSLRKATVAEALITPTENIEVLDARVEALLRQEPVKPKGQEKPFRLTGSAQSFIRDPAVKAWVLHVAAGFCEVCEKPAPFKREDGSSYLEVHHLLPLGEGGPDVIENAVAVCPNCHRELHFGERRQELRLSMAKKVKRLNVEIVS